MTDADGVRDVLLEYSDHRAVRNVFGAVTGGAAAALVDYVESMRATDGDLAVVASDGAAEVYARWDGSTGRYEHVTVWPPWTVGGYDHTDSDGLLDRLEDADDVRPTRHALTPFADPSTLANVSGDVPPDA